MKRFTLALVLFAACADSEEGHDAPTATQPLPDGSSPDAAEASDASPSAVCGDDAWCPEPDVAPRYALTSIWGTTAADVWAVGSVGTVMHYDGAAWTRFAVDSKVTLRTVFANASGVWVGGTARTIFHATGLANGSIAWEPLPELPVVGLGFGPPAAVLSIWGSGANVLVSSVSFRDREDGYLEASTIWQDGGPARAWQDVGPSQCRKCFPETPIGIPGRTLWASDTELWALFGGRVFRANLITRAWQEIDSQSDGDLYAAWGTSSDDVWLVGQSGRIRHWKAGAPIADVVPSPTQQALHAVWGSGGEDIWAAGDLGTVLHYDGKAWLPAKVVLPDGRPPNLYGAWGSGAGAPWIVGEGIILRYHGKGT